MQRGSSAQSGYAIVVSREGLRRARRRIIPPMRMADQLLLSKAAKMSNRYGKTKLPTEPADYIIQYADLGKSIEELKRENIQ